VLAGRFERVGFAAAVRCELFERSPGGLVLLSRGVSSFSSFYCSSH
jgi:hypothetical protein